MRGGRRGTNKSANEWHDVCPLLTSSFPPSLSPNPSHNDCLFIASLSSANNKNKGGIDYQRLVLSSPCESLCVSSWQNVVLETRSVAGTTAEEVYSSEAEQALRQPARVRI